MTSRIYDIMIVGKGECVIQDARRFISDVAELQES